jgi:sodium/bile acid cotransporter 7
LSTLRTAVSRLPIDPYLLTLMATVGLAALLPARGEAGKVVDGATLAAVAALFFLYGARLSPRAVWAGLSNWRLQALVLASTYVLFPVLGLAVAAMVRPVLPPNVTAGILFLCILPSTVQSSIAFTSIARGDVPAALCAASISNVLGVVVTPLLAAFLLPTASRGFSAEALVDISVQILLPFLAGQVVRRWIGGWLLEHKLLTSIVDRGSILLIVYAAFSAGMIAGVWSQLSLTALAFLLVLCVAILAVALVITTVASRRFGFPTADEIAIVFCGSKKSMAAGLPMAAILFPGHAVGLIVLPLMLFHQIQLFVCAILARRYSAREEGAPGHASSAAQ